MSAVQARRLERVTAKPGFVRAPSTPEAFRGPIDFIAADHER